MEKFAQQGCNIIAIAIGSDVVEISQEIAKKFKVKILPLVLDVRDRKNIETTIGGLEKDWQKIDLMVNCAGVALGRCAMQDSLPDDWDVMIDVNVKGMLYMFKAVVPLMLANKHGHIINIGSITGKEIYPTGGVYSVTKHAVNALTNSMRVDLIGTGVKVSVINPGRVETNLALVRYKGDKVKAAKDYQQFVPLQPQDIANAIYYMFSLPEHVNIHEMTITPSDQVAATLFNKPDRCNLDTVSARVAN